MKLERHSKIVELIGKYEIETQEELAEKLTQAGLCNPGNCIQGYPGIKTDESAGRKWTSALYGP